jgi:TolB-like protein
VLPALDDHKWIVLPFENLSGAPDAEWLRSASANMLYLDLSQWTDVRVVDDERVADMLRATPETRDAKPVSLTAALGVARTAGAGKLVLGDVLKIGSRTRVTAKIFNVRDGARLRSVQQEAAAPDSILSTFDRLAREILNAPAPRRDLGAVGTARLDAYQEYVAGVHALNEFNLVEAEPHFERALSLDSTFALAHYKLAVTMRLIGTQFSLYNAGVQATSAQRLSTPLPARERALIAGLVALTRKEYSHACDAYQELLRTDSLDVEALFGLGECTDSDNNVEVVPGDSTRHQFHSSWNTSIRAFQRVLELDPKNHVAFKRVNDALLAPWRDGCLRSEPPSPCASTPIHVDPTRGTAVYPGGLFTTWIRFSGDTLLTVPVAIPRDTAALQHQMAEAATTRHRRRSLDLALRMADSWVEAGPNESEAHATRGHLLLRLGRLAQAGEEFILTKQVTGAAVASLLIDRFELAVKTEQGTEANRLLDSMSKSMDPQLRPLVAGLGPILGRFNAGDSLTTAMSSLEITRVAGRANRIFAGVLFDSVPEAQRAYLDLISKSTTVTPRSAATLAPYLLGVRHPRTSWPPMEYGHADRRVDMVVAVARGDTARVRADAGVLDSTMASAARAADLDSAWAIVAADGYLIVGDSAAALRSLEFMLDSTVTQTPIMTFVPLGGGSVTGWMLPRAMLLRADLAAALGKNAEARIWYGRFLQLWSNADPEFAPLMARVRAAYDLAGRDTPFNGAWR